MTKKVYQCVKCAQLTTCVIGKHLSDCEHAQYLASLQNQFCLLNDIPLPSDNVPTPIENLVFDDFRILHLTRSTSYNILAFLEALLIKYNNPQLNTGLKASKELQLFTHIITLIYIFTFYQLGQCLSTCTHKYKFLSCKYCPTVLGNPSFPVTQCFRSFALYIYICCM